MAFACQVLYVCKEVGKGHDLANIGAVRVSVGLGNFSSTCFMANISQNIPFVFPHNVQHH